jgi:hypothetical protein
MTGSLYGAQKYAAPLYGDGTYPAAASITWIVLVDWEDTGSFPGTNEAAYMTAIEIHRGKQQILASSGGGFEQMQPGTATLTMDNSTRRYDPYYAAGDLYGYLLPGKFIKIAVQVRFLNGTKAIYTRFSGRITDIRPATDTKIVTITAADGLQMLQEINVTTLFPTYKRNVIDCMRDILNVANYPVRWGISPSIEASTLPLSVFDIDNEPASQVLLDLGDATLGQVFIDREGRFSFVNYDHFTSYTYVSEDLILKEIQTAQPWDNVRNDIQVYCNRVAKLNTVSLVWQLPFPIELAASGSDTIQADYKLAADVFFKVGTLVANDSADGTGTDRSANVSVSATCKSNHAEITLTNGIGSTVYVTAVELWGKRYGGEQMSFRAKDDTSITQYGKRTLTFNNRFLQDVNFARFFATELCSFYHDPLDPTSNPKVPVKIQFEQNWQNGQFTPDLFSRIYLDCQTTLGFDTYFAYHQLIAIDEIWSTGNPVLSTWTLSPIFSSVNSVTAAIDGYGLTVPPAEEREIITGSGNPPWIGDPGMPWESGGGDGGFGDDAGYISDFQFDLPDQGGALAEIHTHVAHVYGRKTSDSTNWEFLAQILQFTNTSYSTTPAMLSSDGYSLIAHVTGVYAVNMFLFIDQFQTAGYFPGKYMAQIEVHKNGSSGILVPWCGLCLTWKSDAYSTVVATVNQTASAQMILHLNEGDYLQLWMNGIYTYETAGDPTIVSGSAYYHMTAQLLGQPSTGL